MPAPVARLRAQTRVGRTKGRGKLDRYKAYALPVKDIYLYALARNVRRRLTAPLG